MKDVEIVVFNDKAWVRLTEYQKLQEDFEQFKKGKVCDLCNYNTVGQDEYIDALEEQNKELKAQIKKLREKLFDILSEYEIGNYENNIHQFYQDVYDIHNELMEVVE